MTSPKKVLKNPVFIAEFVETVGWDYFRHYFEIDDEVLTTALTILEYRKSYQKVS